jgi:hypothetical protein
MLLNAVTALVAFLLAQTPFLWPHSPAQSVVTIAAAAMAAMYSVMSLADRRHRGGVAVAGGLLALSAFPFASDVFTMALQLTAGLFFFVVGIAPKVEHVLPAAVVAPPMFEDLEEAERPRNAA